MLKESKHVTNFRKRHLKTGEEITSFADGCIEEKIVKGKNTQCNGSLIITNVQVVFYKKSFLSEVIEIIPLEQITSVVRKPSLGFRTMVINTSHDQLSFKVSALNANENSLLGAIEIGRREISKSSSLKRNNAIKSNSSFNESNKFIGYFL